MAHIKQSRSCLLWLSLPVSGAGDKSQPTHIIIQIYSFEIPQTPSETLASIELFTFHINLLLCFCLER